MSLTETMEQLRDTASALAEQVFGGSGDNRGFEVERLYREVKIFRYVRLSITSSACSSQRNSSTRV